MLRQELQCYLDKVFPGSRIDTEHTIFGPVHIRYELGGELKNGTKKRVRQAVERAMTIFNETFHDATGHLFLLIIGAPPPNEPHEYLRQLFTPQQFLQFYHQEEELNSRYIIRDLLGNESFEKYTGLVTIGKLPLADINVAAILTGIANYEMGFEPALDQYILFLDPTTDKAFQMYDDRGCYVWSDTADKIRQLYLHRNEWIVDYHRSEIDEYFR